MLVDESFADLQIAPEDFGNAPPVALDGEAIPEGLPARFERLLALNPKVRETWESSSFESLSHQAYSLMYRLGACGLTKAEAAAVHVGLYERHGRKEDGIRKAPNALRAWIRGREKAEAWERGDGNGKPSGKEAGEPGPRTAATEQREVAGGGAGHESPRAPTALPMVPLGDFLRRQRAVAPHTVSAWGWGPGGALMVAAMGGLGKSLLIQSLALDLATGERVLSHFEAAQEQRVGLFVLEDPDHEMRARLAASLDGRDPSAARLWVFDREREEILVLGDRWGNPNARGFALLEQILGDLRLTTLLFDPLVELHNAQENDNSEMLRWLKPLRALCRKHSAAIGLSHHTTWGNSGDQHERGATAIRNWADAVFQLRTVQGAQGGTERRRLSVAKMNFGRPFDPMVATIDMVTMRVTVRPEEGTLCSVEELAAFIRNELGGEYEGAMGEFYQKAAVFFGASEKTVRNTFMGLRTAGMVQEQGRGKGFRLA